MGTLAIEILFGSATHQISDSTKPPGLMLRDIVGVFGGATDPCHAPTALLTFQARVTGHPGVHTQWNNTTVIALLSETRWHATAATEGRAVGLWIAGRKGVHGFEEKWTMDKNLNLLDLDRGNSRVTPVMGHGFSNPLEHAFHSVDERGTRQPCPRS